MNKKFSINQSNNQSINMSRQPDFSQILSIVLLLFAIFVIWSPAQNRFFHNKFRLAGIDRR